MADFEFDITVEEGKAYTFPLKNDFAFLDSMVVSWQTFDISAQAGSDYTATRSGGYTVPLNGSVTINVPVAADNKAEEEETFGLFVTIANTVGGVTTPQTFLYTIHIPKTGGSQETSIPKEFERAASAIQDAAQKASTLNGTFEIKNTKFGIIDDLSDTSKWVTTTGKVAGAAGFAGTVINAIDTIDTAFKTYNEKGAGAAAEGATKDIVIGALSGLGGRVVAGGAATAVTFVVGGALAPIVVGVAAGYAASYGIEWALETGYKAVRPQQANALFAMAVAADSFGPYTLGDGPPEPAWEYDTDTDTFTWLKPPSAEVLSRLESQLGFSTKGLTLTGDKERDKADVIMGGFGNDTVRGLTGDDVILGKSGNDKIYGGKGRDVLRGDAGKDTINGDAGADYLFGDKGDDKLNGGEDKDQLTGGAGRDVMTGGEGADVFFFKKTSETGKTPATRDVITDFAPGTDDINLKSIDASSKASGNQAFKWIGTQGFHKKAGELHYSKENPSGTSKDKTIVEGDINGDGKADFQIELTGLKTLAAGDFIL